MQIFIYQRYQKIDYSKHEKFVWKIFIHLKIDVRMQTYFQKFLKLFICQVIFVIRNVELKKLKTFINVSKT